MKKNRGNFKNCEGFIGQCISTEQKNTAIVNEYGKMECFLRYELNDKIANLTEISLVISSYKD